jgi:hypothetical protein
LISGYVRAQLLKILPFTACILVEQCYGVIES